MDAALHSYARRARDSYGSAFAQLYGQTAQTLAALAASAEKKPLRSLLFAGASVLALGWAGMQWGASAVLGQVYGLGLMALGREAAKLPNNSQMMAIGSGLTGLAAVQQGIFWYATGDAGSYAPGVLMFTHSAMTSAAFALIPESRTAFRRAVKWGTGLGGAAAIAATSHALGDATGYIAAASAFSSSILYSLKDGESARVRAAYMVMNAGHIAYWLTQPQIAANLLACDTMFLATFAASARQYDMPVADRTTGEKLCWRAQINGYFRVLASGCSGNEVGIVNNENMQYRRLDTRLVSGIARLAARPLRIA